MRNQSNQNESLRIAMLGHKRVPSREGGVEVVVEELATRVVALGHQVTCYNRKGHHIAGEAFDAAKEERCEEYKGVTLRSVWTLNRRGFAAVTSSVFATILAAFGRYDVVHFHAEGPCAMLWLPKLCGKRCIATVHGLDHQRAKWGEVARFYIMLGEKVAVKHADEIIVLSRAVQEYFKETYNRDTIFVPNGVDNVTPCAADVITKEYGLKKDDYILYLGRIVPEKGLHYLIKAFQELKTDKKLVVAGTGSDTQKFLREIQQMAAGDDRILFTGFVQGEVLSELYSNAYVYALPSDLEGMPLTLLEAMSYGSCCVVSDIAECTEVVEDKALVFEKGDVASLCDVLQRCCNDPSLARSYKEQSAAFICGKYSWDKTVEQTLQCYCGASQQVAKVEATK